MKEKRIITGHPNKPVPQYISNVAQLVTGTKMVADAGREWKKGQQGNKTLVRMSASKAQCRSCYQISSCTRSF